MALPLNRPAIALVASLALLGSALAQTNATPGPTLQGDPTHPAVAHNWLETRLFFGLGPAGTRHGIPEARWRRFLDREVTPRFPAGLSVVDLYGQWQRTPATGQRPTPPERIRSKMILILHQSSPEDASRIAAIRSAWKALTGDQSVLEVTEAVDVSF